MPTLERDLERNHESFDESPVEEKKKDNIHTLAEIPNLYCVLKGKVQYNYKYALHVYICNCNCG